MKGDKTRIILDILANAAQTAGELCDIFFATYHESYRRARNFGIRYRPPPSRNPKVEERALFYNLLAKLNAQGLIEKTHRNAWRPTKRGHKKRRGLHAQQKMIIPRAHYPVKPSLTWNIIMFDIPEKEKRKREWLRAALVAMGCRRLQKSVFAGRIKLPEQFLDDVRLLHLLPHVEIFAITKTGSLKQIE